MMDIQNFIGQSSSEADRQREYYNRMKAEKEALAGESTETPELPEPKEPVLPAEQKSNKAIGNYTTDFEELWEAYPRKVDKGQAYKKYKARLEDGFSHEQFLNTSNAFSTVPTWCPVKVARISGVYGITFLYINLPELLRLFR